MARRKKGHAVHGWINLDKPVGMTSTQAVAKVRWLFQAQKAGHAGTLDPLASGILPIALGEATKTIPYVQDAAKTYEFEISWGESRDTDDSEGKIIATSPVRPKESDISDALSGFLGEIEQVPPKFSAIKIAGERAYDLARSDVDFEIKPRKVFVKSFTLVSSTLEKSCFEIYCGKGTYVRSLARDLALKLGTYGYVSALKRTKTGPFALHNAISLDNLEKLRDSAALNEAFLPLEAALDDILALPLTQGEVVDLRHGKVLTLTARPDYDRLIQAGFEGKEAQKALATLDNKAVAMVEVSGVQIKIIRMFNL